MPVQNCDPGNGDRCVSVEEAMNRTPEIHEAKRKS